MKNVLLIFTIAITTIAIATTTYLSTLENPNEIQQELSKTSNAIAIAGTTAIFGLLNS